MHNVPSLSSLLRFGIAVWYCSILPLLSKVTSLLPAMLQLIQCQRSSIEFYKLYEHIPNSLKPQSTACAYLMENMTHDENRYCSQKCVVKHEAIILFTIWQHFIRIWVRTRNCGCLVTWFCYQLISKSGNKTATVS